MREPGTRRTHSTGGRGVTAIQLSSEIPPVSDFQWYQRPIGRPVPRAIPGAWRRHRQSILLNSTAAGPTNGHTSAHLPLPHRPPIDRPGQPSSVAPSTSNVGQSLSESRTSRPRLVPPPGGIPSRSGGGRVGPPADGRTGG